MALPAVKHMDPVVGIDVHSVIVTPGLPPVFLPHPHIGFMLDLREYIAAAKGVIGSIAMTIAEDAALDYLKKHPDDRKKLTDALNSLKDKKKQVTSDPWVAKALKLNREVSSIEGDVAGAVGAGVGMGATAGRPIFVNGLMRATAGTHSFHVPGLHFPLGETFAPPDLLPSDDAESYMGSRTVLANNDPMSFLALPAMSCWAEGIEPPPHNGAHTTRTHESMPSSVMLPIPVGRPVLVGGPPVMNMAAAAKGMFKAFQGSEWAKNLADKLHLKPGFLRCNVLKAEPVDVTTGEVVVQQNDFTVSGRLPLVWDRYYASHDSYAGAVGSGWRTPADIRLELMRNEGGIGAVAHFPDHATAFNVVPADDGWPARTYDWQRGYALYRQGGQDGRLILRTSDGIEYGFALLPRWEHVARALEGDARLTLRVTHIADLNGNAWAFGRDARGRCTSIAEWTRDGATGRVIECGTRDGATHGDLRDDASAAWLTSLTLIDADGRAYPLVSYEHDRAWNLSAAVDAMAQPHRFDYTEGHRMVSHTSARGVAFRYSYCVGDDGVWRVDRAWGDDGLFDYRFAYDRAKLETRIVDSRGYASVLQLNARGLPVAEIDPLGGITSYRYDAQSRANAQTDPAGRTTAWEYDRYGNLIAQTLPDGSAVRTQYDAGHHPVNVTLPGGRQWCYERDARGNLLTQTAPDGATSRYTYDTYGQPIEHTGPRGALTRFDYDRDGNPILQINALGHRTQYRHDARGNLVETIDALGQRSRYEYDRNGNLIRAIEPGGREIHCAYDAGGNLVRYRDPAGRATKMAYSALGQVSRRSAPDGTSVEYRYDTEEQLVGVVNERGEHYGLERDALGRIVAETDYWGQTRRYRYGAAGELLDSTDPSGQVVGYQYDRLGRVVHKRVPDHAQLDGVRLDRFEYDRHGDLVLAQNPSCRVEFHYDEVGRVIREQQGDDFTIASVYDIAGNRTERRTRLVAGDGIVEHIVRYRHDALNIIESIQIDDTAPVVLERDALGRVRAEHLGAELLRELSWEASGQLASQRTLLTGTGMLFASEYAYDANGELIEKRDSRFGTERFQYDPVGRVTSHLDPIGRVRRYLYDPAGDLLKTHIRERRTTGAADATQTGTWVREGEYDGCYHAYDRIGNLIRRQDAAQDLALRWDAAGQLIEIVAVRPALPGGMEGQVRIRAQYEYDPFQRRVRKTVWTEPGPVGGAGPASRVSRFFWDGNHLVAEYAAGDDEPRNRTTADSRHGAPSGSGRVCEWVHYPDTFTPLATMQSDLSASDVSAQAAGHVVACPGTVYFYQNDPNGAPVRMHDARGTVVWEGRYGVTGGVEGAGAAGAGGVVQPLRLQGQYFDQESRLHYNRYRHYDPHSGSFASCDPIGLAGGTGLYGYGKSSLTWIDPLGLHASGGDIYVRGSAGQILSVSGTIDPAHIRTGTGTNATSRAWARSLGRATDDAGHTRGCLLGGSGGKAYVFPQAPGINRGLFRDFEGEIAKEVTGRWSADFEQTHIFGNGSATRPVEIRYKYTRMLGGLMVPVTGIFQNP